MLNMPKCKVKLSQYSCPCCGASEVTNVEKEQIYGFTLDICKSCGFIYRQNFFDAQSHSKFMKKFHKSLPTQDYYQKELISAYIINQLLEINDTDRVLYFGSGLGIAASKLPAKKIVCSEPCESHHLFDRYINKNDSRNYMMPMDKSMDLIILNDYIQHIPDLDTFINIVHNKLNADGLVYVSVPVIERPAGSALIGRIPDNIANVFTTDTLLNLFESKGFEVDTAHPYLIHPVYIFRKADKKDIRIIQTEQTYHNFCKVVDLVKQRDWAGVKKINNQVAEAYFKSQFHTPEDIDLNMISEEMTEATSAMPNYIPIMGAVAQFITQTQNHEKAIDIYEMIKTITCDSFIATLLASCYYDVGIFDLAIENAKLAIELTPPSEEHIKMLSSAAFGMRGMD